MRITPSHEEGVMGWESRLGEGPFPRADIAIKVVRSEPELTQWPPGRQRRRQGHNPNRGCDPMWVILPRASGSTR